jgi:hypothetical protein
MYITYTQLASTTADYLLHRTSYSDPFNVVALVFDIKTRIYTTTLRVLENRVLRATESTGE